MGYRDSQNEILNLIKSNNPFIYVVTEDETPVIKTAKEIAKKMPEQNFDVISWNFISGFKGEYGANAGKIEKFNNTEMDLKQTQFKEPESLNVRFLRMMKGVLGYKGNAIFVLSDIDDYLERRDEMAIEFKDTIMKITHPLESIEEKLEKHRVGYDGQYQKYLILMSNDNRMSKHLEKIANVVRFGKPGVREIKPIVEKIVKINELNVTKEEIKKTVTSCLGLTEQEIINAINLSIVKTGTLNAETVNNMKKELIRKNGLVEFVEHNVKIEDVGGMSNLIEWLKRRSLAFDEELRKKRSLSHPKGILLTGVQGCGKSYISKAISSLYEMPLVRFDIGQLMDKWVGSSEENVRKAIETVESLAPVVLWIDEIEKAITSGPDGHEVSKRILGFLLTWLQEKESQVFVVATANNMELLPPELLRKGRLDELFFVDLPDAPERKQILNIHLGKRNIDASNIDIDKVVEMTEGYSGAELEALVNEANFQSAYENSEVKTEHLINEIKRTSPLSVIMKDKINFIRDWAKAHSIRPAK